MPEISGPLLEAVWGGSSVIDSRWAGNTLYLLVRDPNGFRAFQKAGVEDYVLLGRYHGLQSTCFKEYISEVVSDRYLLLTGQPLKGGVLPKRLPSWLYHEMVGLGVLPGKERAV